MLYYHFFPNYRNIGISGILEHLECWPPVDLIVSRDIYFMDKFQPLTAFIKNNICETLKIFVDIVYFWRSKVKVRKVRDIMLLKWLCLLINKIKAGRFLILSLITIPQLFPRPFCQQTMKCHDSWNGNIYYLQGNVQIVYKKLYCFYMQKIFSFIYFDCGCIEVFLVLLLNVE